MATTTEIYYRKPEETYEEYQKRFGAEPRTSYVKYDPELGRHIDIFYELEPKGYGDITPEFPTYEPYTGQIPSLELPGMKPTGAYPGMTQMPTYQPTAQPYPITKLPVYQPTGEAYPEYQRPETGGLVEGMRETITARMRGEGTVGAESAIYERGEERVQRQYEEGLKRIDEEMGARGLTGSGIHGEAVRKLEEERQRSLADLSRQITIYGQEAIESAMGRAQQYVEYEAAESAREIATKQAGWAARVGESIRSYESQARAAEARGASEQAAYQTAIAERIRAYESRAKAAEAKNIHSMRKWESETELHMKRYQLELQKSQQLYQAKTQAYEMGKEEYWRAYQANYQATRDRYLAEQEALRAAEEKVRFEWEKEQKNIETYFKRMRMEQAEKKRKYREEWEVKYKRPYGSLPPSWHVASWFGG